MLKNYAGDICLAGVQENNRRAKEARQSLLFEFHTQAHLEPFHPFPPVRYQLGLYAKTEPVGTDQHSQMEPFQAVSWKREVYPYQDCHGSRGNAAEVYIKGKVKHDTVNLQITITGLPRGRVSGKERIITVQEFP